VHGVHRSGEETRRGKKLRKMGVGREPRLHAREITWLVGGGETFIQGLKRSIQMAPRVEKRMGGRARRVIESYS